MLTTSQKNATNVLTNFNEHKCTQVDMAGTSRLTFSSEEILAFLEEKEDDGDIDVFCHGSDNGLGFLDEEVEEEVDDEVEEVKVNDQEESGLAVRWEHRCLATEQAYLNHLVTGKRPHC